MAKKGEKKKSKMDRAKDITGTKNVKKIAVNKMFGMKNKAGKKGRELSQNMTGGAAAEAAKAAKRKKIKEQKEKEAAEIAALFKSAHKLATKKMVTLDPGVDPKTIVCEFFKKGMCKKGKRCKFSHDFSKTREKEKINLYADSRSEQGMENWDQKQLEEAVTKASTTRTQPPTDIICKYFLEAIENKKYGYFWVCENGGSECKYRHALPPGFILKKKKTADELALEKANELDLDEVIATEIAELRKREDLTPITLATFTAWDERRKKRRAEEEKKAIASKTANKKQKTKGKGICLNGRELFVFDETLFVDDEGAADEYVFEEKEEAADAEISTTTKSVAKSTIQEDSDVKIDESLFADNAL